MIVAFVEFEFKAVLVNEFNVPIGTVTRNFHMLPDSILHHEPNERSKFRQDVVKLIEEKRQAKILPH